MNPNRERCQHFLLKILDADETKALWKKKFPTRGKPAGKSKSEMISEIVAIASMKDFLSPQEITVDKMRSYLNLHAKLSSEGTKSQISDKLICYLCETDQQVGRKRAAAEELDIEVAVQRQRQLPPQPATPTDKYCKPMPATSTYSTLKLGRADTLSGWWKRFNCVTKFSRCCGVDAAGEFVVSDSFLDKPLQPGMQVTDAKRGIIYVLSGPQCAEDEREDLFGPYPDVMRGGFAVNQQLSTNLKDFVNMFRMHAKKVDGTLPDCMSSQAHIYNSLKLANALELQKVITGMDEDQRARIPQNLSTAARRCGELYEELKKETATIHEILYCKDKRSELAAAMAANPQSESLQYLHSRRIECLAACELRAGIVRQQNAEEKEMEERMQRVAVQEKQDIIRSQLALVNGELTSLQRRFDKASEQHRVLSREREDYAASLKVCLEAMMRSLQLHGNYDREANGELRFLTEMVHEVDVKLISSSEILADMCKEKEDFSQRRQELTDRLRALQ